MSLRLPYVRHRTLLHIFFEVVRCWLFWMQKLKMSLLLTYFFMVSYKKLFDIYSSLYVFVGGFARVSFKTLLIYMDGMGFCRAGSITMARYYWKIFHWTVALQCLDNTFPLAPLLYVWESEDLTLNIDAKVVYLDLCCLQQLDSPKSVQHNFLF